MKRIESKADNSGALAARTLDSTRGIVAAYVLAMAGAQAIFVFVNPVYGTLCDAALLFGLLHQASVERARADDDARAGARGDLLFAALALVPLLQILSVSVPIPDVRSIYWYAMIGVPAAAALVLTARLGGRDGLRRAFPFRWSPVQLLVAATGVPLGVAAFVIARHDGLLTTRPTPHDLLVGIPLLFVFVGVYEELLFRGLLQGALVDVLGRRSGLLWGGAVFGISYLGSGSVAYLAFFAATGLFFGWIVLRTRSLLGVVIAHGLLAVFATLVLPYLLM
jgi:membrane protease YdiL (CAAX protease family)